MAKHLKMCLPSSRQNSQTSIGSNPISLYICTLCDLSPDTTRADTASPFINSTNCLLVKFENYLTRVECPGLFNWGTAYSSGVSGKQKKITLCAIRVSAVNYYDITKDPIAVGLLGAVRVMMIPKYMPGLGNEDEVSP